MSGPREASAIEADLDVANAAVSIGHRGSPALAAALQAELNAHDAHAIDLREGREGDLTARFHAECAVALAVGFPPADEPEVVEETDEAPEEGDETDPGDQGGSPDATAGETVPSGTGEPAPEFPDQEPWENPPVTNPPGKPEGDAPAGEAPAVPSVGPDPS